MFQPYDDPVENEIQDEKPKRKRSDSDETAKEHARSIVSRLIEGVANAPEKPKRGGSSHPIEGYEDEPEKPKRDGFSYPIEHFSLDDQSPYEKPKRGTAARQGIDAAYMEQAFVLNRDSWKFLRGESPTIPGNGGLVLVLVGALFLMFLAPFVINDALSTKERETTGRTAIATVLGKRVSRGKSTSYYLTYEFRTHTEHTIQREENVNSGLYGTAVGASLEVIYAENNPHNARLVLNSKSDFWIMLFVLVVFPVPLIGGGLMMWWRLHRLNRYGILLPGGLTRCNGSSGKNGYTVTARYQFRTPDGQYLTGTSSSQRNDLRRGRMPQRGAPVIVIWDGRSIHRML